MKIYLVLACCLFYRPNPLAQVRGTAKAKVGTAGKKVSRPLPPYRPPSLGLELTSPSSVIGPWPSHLRTCGPCTAQYMDLHHTVFHSLLD